MKPESAALWLIASLVGSACFSPSARAMEILIPAYFYPAGDPARWDELTAATGTLGITAIMNPDNGPGNDVNSDYSAALHSFRAQGGKVIGYVSTGYGTRDATRVRSEIDRYTSFYSIDGIFLDEMSSDPGRISYYRDLYEYIKGESPAYRVFGNPGTHTDESYLSVADVLVTFENGSGYPAYRPDAWTFNYSAGQFGHLLYDVEDAATMLNYIHLAAAWNIGYVYVTDDVLNNPWDTLPSYWNIEIAAVAAVPAPPAAILMLAGIIVVVNLARPHRRQYESSLWDTITTEPCVMPEQFCRHASEGWHPVFSLDSCLRRNDVSVFTSYAKLSRARTPPHPSS